MISRYHPTFPKTLVYMLQASEYRLSDFWPWFKRSPSLRFSSVAKRRSLDMTAKAKLLLLASAALALVGFAAAAILFIIALVSMNYWFAIGGAVLLLLTPWLVAGLLSVVLLLGQVVVQRPREKKIIAAAAQQIGAHKGYRIAIAGSYGKTTFKETLATVLGAGKKVAMTPGNKNTPLGISQFVRTLDGTEDIIIFELGEYYPGDVATLCELVKPDLGIITGINEAHLSKFKSIDRTVATIFELADYLGNKPVYKNGENELVVGRAQNGDPLLYTAQGVNGWQVSDAVSSLDGTSFVATKGDVRISAHAGLLGLHQVGPLVACIDIADRLGLTGQQITDGLSRVVPFEHRMQPRQLHGAWIIDDTYNGNFDGAKVGIAFLAGCQAKRRIYVTPGLVEQGSKTAEVHEEIGRLLAGAADVVVLMCNSVTPYIQDGLEKAKFKGELKVIDDPVPYYQNLDQTLAAGDVVLLQNDWTDNYN